MKNKLSLIILLFLLLPSIFATLCYSPKENCERIKDLTTKAIDNSDLSFCDIIYNEKIIAYFKTEYTHLDGNLSSIDIKGYCYDLAVREAKKEDMCSEIGNKYNLCEGETKNKDLCQTNSVGHYKEMCYLNLAKNLRDPKYCKNMQHISKNYECYQNTGSYKQYYYGTLIFLQNTKEGILFYLFYGVGIILPISLILTMILFIFFIKIIRARNYFKSIILGIVLLILIFLVLFELWVILFAPHIGPM